VTSTKIFGTLELINKLKPLPLAVGTIKRLCRYNNW
jgi:hypothetical protein